MQQLNESIVNIIEDLIIQMPNIEGIERWGYVIGCLDVISDEYRVRKNYGDIGKLEQYTNYFYIRLLMNGSRGNC